MRSDIAPAMILGHRSVRAAKTAAIQSLPGAAGGRRLAMGSAVLLALFLGCSETPRPGIPGARLQLQVKGTTVEVEVASDPLSHRRGLMHRRSLPENAGMLFIYPPSQRGRLSFWMRNTSIPLSIAFLDDDGKILQIEDMRPKDETSTWSKTRVRYALEVNQGWFARHGIEVGDSFTDFREKVRAFDGP